MLVFYFLLTKEPCERVVNELGLQSVHYIGSAWQTKTMFGKNHMNQFLNNSCLLKDNRHGTLQMITQQWWFKPWQTIFRRNNDTTKYCRSNRFMNHTTTLFLRHETNKLWDNCAISVTTSGTTIVSDEFRKLEQYSVCLRLDIGRRDPYHFHTNSLILSIKILLDWRNFLVKAKNQDIIRNFIGQSRPLESLFTLYF